MKRLIKYNLKKEIIMFIVLSILVIIFVSLLQDKEMLFEIENKDNYNRVIAADSLENEIKKPDYNSFMFVDKATFFKYQVGRINKKIYYCEIIKDISDVNNNIDGKALIKINSINKNKIRDEYCDLIFRINLKNISEKAGLIKVKPICQIMLDNGIYDDALNDKFTLVDMSFDTDVEGYTLANVPADNGKINTDMGFVRTDDWSKHFFRVYIESNSEISYTCVFRTPKEYADDENLVIGNDDSHASRRWDGEKEVTYDNGGYRIYINRQ